MAVIAWRYGMRSRYYRSDSLAWPSGRPLLNPKQTSALISTQSFFDEIPAPYSFLQKAAAIWELLFFVMFDGFGIVCMS